MKIHFIAIGGSAMHNLALALNDKGHEVTGSDDAIFEPSRTRLACAGILPPQEGWFPEKIAPDTDAVILGMHARADNPELKKAMELGIRIYSYPEFLYEESKDKTRIVIGGSHGKTTITSMILHAMKYGGVKTDYMVGAQLEGFDRMVELTPKNPYIVIEGDEYLSSPLDPGSKFLHYHAKIAVISGIAWDHMNVFPTYPQYTETFSKFIQTIQPAGTLIYNGDDPEVVGVVGQAVAERKKPLNTIAYHTPDYKVRDGQAILEIPDRSVPLKIFGAHNLSNLEAARQVCLLAGITDECFYRAMESFSGAARRLEEIVRNETSVIYRDFAHAPSKVRATVAAVRELYPDKHLVAALELHTYSSLNKDFLPQYKNTLGAADVPLVFYSREAMELKRMDPIPEETVAGDFGINPGNVFSDIGELKRVVCALPSRDTVFLFMSSGNWDKTDWSREIKL